MRYRDDGSITRRLGPWAPLPLGLLACPALARACSVEYMLVAVFSALYTCCEFLALLLLLIAAGESWPAHCIAGGCGLLTSAAAKCLYVRLF